MGERRPFSKRARWLLAASAFAVLLGTGVPLYEALNEPVPESATPAGNARFDARALAAVEAVLSPRRTVQEPTLEALVDALVALKARALPVLVAVACGDLPLPEFAIGTENEPIHPRAIELRDQAVARAIQRFPAPQVAEQLRVLCDGAPLEVELVAAKFLGDCDDPSALDTLLAITRRIDPIQLQSSSMCQPLEGALAKHFARHPQAIETVELSGPSDAWQVLVRAAGAARTTTAARWLAEQLGMRRELDLAVIEELGRSAEGGRFALPEAVVERLRDALPRGDDQMRRVAAIALGAARESEAFDDLVFLLDETDPLIVVAARHGLSEIVRRDLGADPGAWLDWRVEQDRWYAEHAKPLLEQLATADPVRASEAMGEMLAHGFFRHEWAYEIGALLANGEGPVFATACASAAALGSSRAVPWLVDALDRADDHERELARDALRALTGLDVAAEREAWRAALEL